MGKNTIIIHLRLCNLVWIVQNRSPAKRNNLSGYLSNTSLGWQKGATTFWDEPRKTLRYMDFIGFIAMCSYALVSEKRQMTSTISKEKELEVLWTANILGFHFRLSIWDASDGFRLLKIVACPAQNSSLKKCSKYIHRLQRKH